MKGVVRFRVQGHGDRGGFEEDHVTLFSEQRSSGLTPPRPSMKKIEARTQYIPVYPRIRKHIGIVVPETRTAKRLDASPVMSFARPERKISWHFGE